MEAFYNPDLWKSTDPSDKMALALEAFVLEIERQKTFYLESHQLRDLPIDVEDDFTDRLDIGAGMLAYHAQFVHPKYDDWFRPIMVEIPFEVPLEDPDRPGHSLKCFDSPHCGQKHSNDPLSDDSNVVYSGRVDMLAEDLRYGGYLIWDHKTADQLPKDEEFLQLDDQVGGYVFALKYKLGLDVRGFIYAATRKNFPREPRLLKRTQKGCQFSTAHTQATSIEVFEPYVARHDSQAFLHGAYDEYLAFLRSSDATQFHKRLVIIKSDAELRNIGKNIALEAADMVDSKTRIYPSVGRFTCLSCPYRQPCLSEYMGEDTQMMLEGVYIKTDHKYWEKDTDMEDAVSEEEKVG
jgi:hypothetical protein